GLACAAISATSRNGHFTGSLQAWTYCSFIRQPVSPSTRMRLGSAAGTAMGMPDIATDVAPEAICRTQTVIRNCADGAARTVMVCGAPSTSAGGHSHLSVI